MIPIVRSCEMPKFILDLDDPKLSLAILATKVLAGFIVSEYGVHQYPEDTYDQIYISDQPFMINLWKEVNYDSIMCYATVYPSENVFHHAFTYFYPTVENARRPIDETI
jgi:hypothetical protein